MNLLGDVLGEHDKQLEMIDNHFAGGIDESKFKKKSESPKPNIPKPKPVEVERSSPIEAPKPKSVSKPKSAKPNPPSVRDQIRKDKKTKLRPRKKWNNNVDVPSGESSEPTEPSPVEKPNSSFPMARKPWVKPYEET
jgi:hypothetical protein